MNCEQVQKRIDAYLDGETLEDESRQLRRHVQHCPECSVRFGRLIEVGQSLSDLPDIAAPEGLVSGVLRELSARDTASPDGPLTDWGVRGAAWVLGATGAVATVGIVAAVVWILGLAPEWSGAIHAAGAALAGPGAACALWLVDIVVTVASACAQILAYGMLIDLALLAAALLALVAWRSKSQRGVGMVIL